MRAKPAFRGEAYGWAYAAVPGLASDDHQCHTIVMGIECNRSKPNQIWAPPMTNVPNARSDRINSEMLDTIDEELEMEIDDDRLAKLLTEIAEHPKPETLDRRVYFKELLRLQGEL